MGMHKRPLFDKGGLEVAHPGASYNPSLEMHQSLLFKETLKEADKVKKAENIERAIYVDPSTIATSQSRRDEDLEGLLDDESEDGSDDEALAKESNTEEVGTRSATEDKRKSKKARKIA